MGTRRSGQGGFCAEWDAGASPGRPIPIPFPSLQGQIQFSPPWITVQHPGLPLNPRLSHVNFPLSCLTPPPQFIILHD